MLRHYIGGEHVDSASGNVLDVTDPVTHTVYATVAAGDAADVDRAVAAARKAFAESGWADMPSRHRSETLRAIADAIEARADVISPQCGFSSSHHGNELDEDAQWSKLRRVVEVADEVWK